MKWLIYGLTFTAGAVVGAIVTREIAIRKVEDPVGKAADALLGDGSYASGQVKTWANMFLRNS